MMQMRNDKFRRKGKFLFVLFFPLMWLLLSAIVMWLWNTILPTLLNTNKLTYWQSVGLLLLCRILFGGFKFGRPGGKADFGNRFGNMREKWMNMSDEDRIKFKTEMRNRCHPSRKPFENKEPDAL
jgi:hypothetical protein